MKYEIWMWENGAKRLVSTHRLYRVAKSHQESYVRQGKSTELIRKKP